MRAHIPVVLFALGACTGSDDAVKVSLSPSFVFPRGLLDSVTKVTVKVYETAAGLDCDAATGKLTQDAKPVATKELGTSLPSGPCPSGGKFCGDITIPKSDSARLFQAQAAAATNADFADGCAKVVANQDALPLKIVMIRNVPPAVCNNGKIESTEQCEPPDSTCDASCHTKELLLSNGSNPTSTGNPGDKTSPFFLWPAGTGDLGRLLAFFSDKTANSLSGSREIELRVMGDNFTPLANFLYATFVPNDPGQAPPPQPEPRLKQLPIAAAVGAQYVIVFDDDRAGTPDIHLRSMDSSFAAQQPFNAPFEINGPGGGELGIQTAPSVAAASDTLFIAWEDQGAQKIAGRTAKLSNPPNLPPTLGTQQDISSGSGNKGAQIAWTGSGWVAVWEGAGDIKLRSIDTAGRPFGNETVVNENTAGLQDHASIAALADGRFAVAFCDHQTANGADIIVQRFKSDGSKVPGDQATAANTTVTGDQVAPRIAGMNAAGGSFVVVWLDAQTRHVRGRLLGGSAGALFNNVDGQSGDFQASIAEGRTRANPSVAVGGSGPFIAIGWEDQSGTAPFGIIGRRFPLPTQ